MRQLVIFDLDGTLLNTLADLAQATNAALQACGFAVRTQAQVQAFVGNGVSKLLERALPPQARTAAQVERVRHAFFDYYDAHLWTHTTPYEGVETMLRTLDKQGILLAVASNKYQAATVRLIHHFFPHIPFAGILGQREQVPVKPHPQIVHELMDLARVPARGVLYVGDSDVDIQTARNAGVRACGVSWGFRSRDILLSCKPDYLADTPAQVPALLTVPARKMSFPKQ